MEKIRRVFVTPLVVLALVTFLSCGHQEQKDGGLFADMSEESQESVGDSASGGEVAVVDGDSMKELEATVGEDGEARQPAPAGEDLAAATEIVPEEGQTVASNDQASETLEIPAGETASAETPALMGDEAPQREIGTTTGSESTPKAAVRSRLPRVPQETVWKKGHTLNRYYFLRESDTPDKVAELVYGDATRSSDLAVWNSGSWAAGRVILYASPERAEDTVMRSFYEERGVTPETYTVQAGDWLSKIAMNTFGSAGSWKEIALLNSLANPDKIKPGTQLSLYPTVFPAKIAPPEKVAVAEPAKPAPLVAETDMVASSQKDESVVVDAPRPEPELASAEVGTFFERHFLMVVGAFSIILVGYVLRRRSRRNDMME